MEGSPETTTVGLRASLGKESYHQSSASRTKRPASRQRTGRSVRDKETEMEGELTQLVPVLMMALVLVSLHFLLLLHESGKGQEQKSKVQY